MVRLKRAPEFGRPPGLFGAAVEEAAAVLEVLVLPEDFPPKRLPPPKRFLAPFAGVAAVVVVGDSASAWDVLSSSSGSSSLWCREWTGDGRRPN